MVSRVLAESGPLRGTSGWTGVRAERIGDDVEKWPRIGVVGISMGGGGNWEKLMVLSANPDALVSIEGLALCLEGRIVGSELALWPTCAIAVGSPGVR